MATNGKPSTRFTITYGDLPVESTGGSLTPVIVAPRYAVHKPIEGYAGSALGLYNINGMETATSYAFPDYFGGKIDSDSCKLCANKALVVISEEGDKITGTISSVNPNCVVTSTTVKSVGTTQTVGLSGYSIMSGDKVKVTVGGVSKVGSVIDVLPTYEVPTPEVVALTSNAGTADFSGLALSVGNVIEDVVYLAKLVAIDTNSYKFEIRAIAGDAGYYIVKTVKAGEEISIGTVALKGVLTEAMLSAMAINDGFIFKAFAERVKSFDKVYLNVDLAELISDGKDSATADLEFYKAFGAGAINIGTNYWDITDVGVSVPATVFISIANKQYRLAEAELSLEYRELITDDANVMISTNGAIASEFAGVFDPMNPMGFAYTVFNAVSSGFGGATAFMIAVEEDSDAGYRKAIERAGRYEDAYGIVPIRSTEAVDAFVKEIIAKYSSPEVAQFKCGWLTSKAKQESVVLDADENGVAIIGTVADGKLTILAGDLIKAGVREGDIVSISGGVDGSSIATNVSYKVKRLESATSAILEGAAGAVVSAGCVTISRKMNSSEFAEAIAAEAASINNYRIKLIAADQINYGGFEDVDKAYLAVACAAMRAALAPHAPLTDRVLDGFTISEKIGWTDADFEVMNRGGAWVVYNDIDGAVKNYHQITTRTDGTIAEEDSAVSNGDSMVRELRSAIRPLASGSSNASEAVLGEIEAKVHAVMSAIAARNYPAELGPQFEDYSIVALYRPAGNRQRIVGKFNITGQLPLQDGEFGFNLI